MSYTPAEQAASDRYQPLVNRIVEERDKAMKGSLAFAPGEDILSNFFDQAFSLVSCCRDRAVTEAGGRQYIGAVDLPRIHAAHYSLAYAALKPIGFVGDNAHINQAVKDLHTEISRVCADELLEGALWAKRVFEQQRTPGRG